MNLVAPCLARRAKPDRGRVHLEELERPTAHLLLPCRSGSVHTVRALLHRDLERWGVPGDVADGILLAAAEAVTTAVVGSLGQQGAALMVRWSLAGGLFSLTVQDRSPGRTDVRAALARRAHPSQNRGRGLYLMHAIMDRVVVDSSLGGTHILLERAIGVETPA